MEQQASSNRVMGFAVLCLLLVLWLRDTRERIHKDTPRETGTRDRVVREAPPPLDEKAIAASITSTTDELYRPARGTLESSQTGSRWSLKEVQGVYADGTRGLYYTFTESKRVITEVGYARDGSFYPVTSFLVRERFPNISNVWMPQLFAARAISYRSDKENFQYQDVWQLPAELVRQGSGDCEDLTVLVVDWLIEKGFDARVAEGYMGSVKAGNGHAWAVVFNPDIKDFVVIEATSKRFMKTYPLAKYERKLIPKHMWNRTSFWENTGFPDNFDYSSPLWKQRSVFHPVP